MAAHTTTLTPELLEPWATEVFYNQYAEHPQLYPRVFNVVASSRAMEDTFQVSPLGTFRVKPEGTPISYDTPVQSLRKRVVHTTYALGYRVTKEMMDDEQFGMVKKFSSDLGNSARDHKERLAWSLFDDAFAGNTYRGLPEADNATRSLCNTGHLRLKDGGTSSNRLSPDVAFSVSGLQSAITNFRLTQNEAGRRTPLTPKLVVHHPNDEFVVAQVLDSQQEPFTADNQINSVSTSRMGITALAVPYLSDTDNWFLMCDKSMHTIKWYNRMDLDFDRNKDSQTKDALFDAMYRASVTFDDWRGIVGSAP